MVKKQQVASHKKENYEYASQLITWSIAITVLMAGIVFYTFRNLNGVSIFLIIIYFLILLSVIFCGIYSIIKKSNKCTIIGLILMGVLVLIWALVLTMHDEYSNPSYYNHVRDTVEVIERDNNVKIPLNVVHKLDKKYRMLRDSGKLK